MYEAMIEILSELANIFWNVKMVKLTKAQSNYFIALLYMYNMHIYNCIYTIIL